MSNDKPMTANDRRNFLKACGKYGFTVAAVAAAGGGLSQSALAFTKKEQEERKKNAKHVITIATAYAIGASRSYPIMQVNFKDNIENLSNGEIYVKLAPAGQLGAGGALAQKVQGGTIQIAQHSMSNFAPFAPAVDVINIPYMCGKNQEFINLVTSDEWKKTVNPKVEQNGFKILMYVIIDARVVAMRKGFDKIVKVPSDLSGVKFRVPGSKILQQYYRLLGANPTPVAWGETPSAIKQGVADALDPCVGALNVFGFKDVLSSVTFSNPVPDGQVYSCNLEWFNGLPNHLQMAVERASDITFRQSLASVGAARAFAMYNLTRSGVKFYTPTASELKQWQDKAGYQRKEWDPFIKKLVGGRTQFNKLLKASRTQGVYYVDTV